MTPIYQGTTAITGCYRGTVEVSAIYRGTALVWAKSLLGFSEATVTLDASIRSYRSTTHSSSSLGVSDEIVNRPWNVAQGDLLLLTTIGSTGATGSYVVPSGFTELGRVIGSVGARLIVSYKIATASEPASYTYAQYNSSSNGVSMMTAIRDWSGNTADIRSAFSSDTNTNLVAPSVTPATSRNLLLTAIAAHDTVGRAWGWIPPVGAGNVGYSHNSSYLTSGAVSHERWNSSSNTGTRTWDLNTSSTQTARYTASVTVPSGTVTKTITQFLAGYAQTKGSGGALTDTTDNTFVDSTGLSSKYHLFASGLNWDKNVGIIIYTDGSAEYGLNTPQITSQSPYLLYGTSGLIAVAKRHNMVLLTPRAPGDDCNDGDGVCWYDHSIDNTTPWQKLEWSNELVRKILSEYNIDRRRMVIGGYSSGAQWTMSWWGPKYASEIMIGGAAVAISYGGQPRVAPRVTSAYKSNIPHVWDVGANDSSWSQPNWDDGIHTGRDWYQNNGFATTDVTVVPGLGHDRYVTASMVGDFGPIIEREIIDRVVDTDGNLPQPPTSSDVYLRTMTTNTVTSSLATKNLYVPTDTAQGDLMLLIYAVYGTSSGNGALPSGFTQIAKYSRNTSHTLFVGWRIATASEPEFYLPTIPSGNSYRGDLLIYRNATSTNLGTPSVATSPAAIGNHAAPSVTPTTNRGRLVSFVSGGGGNNWTTPTGMRRRTDNQTGASHYLTLSVADQAVTSNSPTGTRSFVNTAGNFSQIVGSLFIPAVGSA